MSPPRALLVGFLVLATLTLRAAPGWAHVERAMGLAADVAVGSSEDFVEPRAEPESARAATPELPGRAVSASPDAPGLPWPAIVVALSAVALGWRRPRRAVALALILLLAVFAFEGARHSVHHGFDGRFSACAMATAAAHVTATEVDSCAPSEVILPLMPMAAETAHGAPAARVDCPDRGRAPPRSIA